MSPEDLKAITDRAARAAIVEYVRRVNERAAQNIKAAGHVTWAYRNAMKAVAKEMQIEVKI